MRIHNRLPLLLDCLKRWEKPPSPKVFEREYAEPMSEVAGGFFSHYHGLLLDLDWNKYRTEALRLDSAAEEARVLRGLEAVEALFGFKLHGEIVLQGAFGEMDGYARFEGGTHKVFLGMDESHGLGRYLDVLIAHELTHVARESRPSVWEGFGLNPKMSNEQFMQKQPVIEHLFGEGFSCAVSELLVPGEPAWLYAYQSRESLDLVLSQARMLDRAIHTQLRRPNADYRELYGLEPLFSHYVWAWQWVKKLLTQSRNPRDLVSTCSNEFLANALDFSLAKVNLAT